jgi:hypothetical protein
MYLNSLDENQDVVVHFFPNRLMMERFLFEEKKKQINSSQENINRLTTNITN